MVETDGEIRERERCERGQGEKRGGGDFARGGGLHRIPLIGTPLIILTLGTQCRRRGEEKRREREAGGKKDENRSKDGKKNQRVEERARGGREREESERARTKR